MKARIWKDHVTGRWCYDVQGYGLRATGDRGNWTAALGEALTEVRWISEHKRRWPFSDAYEGAVFRP